MACGLWQLKQPSRLALAFAVLSARKAWYSHSPLRFASEYSAPHPGPLLHYGVAEDVVRLGEAAIGILGGVALGVELCGILHDGDHRAVRKRGCG